MHIPFEAQNLDIELDLNQHTLKHVSNTLKSLNQKIEDVSFHTLDNAIIPDFEILKHRNNIPFIMTVTKNGVKWNYAINLNEGFAIANHGYRNKNSEEAYLEYCLGIGLPKYSSFILANFASKLHHTLPKENKVGSETILKGL